MERSEIGNYLGSAENSMSNSSETSVNLRSLV
jgi:hypothetical protein